MTQDKKIEKVAKLFDEIRALFPKNHLNMNIHGIDIKKLPEGWKIKENVSYDSKTGDKKVMLTAKRSDECFDLVLFGK